MRAMNSLHVYADSVTGWEEYSVRHDIESFNKIENEYSLPWSVLLGAAGLPGSTLVRLRSDACTDCSKV